MPFHTPLDAFFVVFEIFIKLSRCVKQHAPYDLFGNSSKNNIAFLALVSISYVAFDIKQDRFDRFWNSLDSRALISKKIQTFHWYSKRKVFDLSYAVF